MLNTGKKELSARPNPKKDRYPSGLQLQGTDDTAISPKKYKPGTEFGIVDIKSLVHGPV